ncbi:hypothetical protein CVU37_14075 [candidate division BRC1 bacterium HGW-BRC1-1]|nr:MAG: hypothetical protein CVU37_14075 [candidate division BRC1 bacterium HGW-BRC1-1]
MPPESNTPMRSPDEELLRLKLLWYFGCTTPLIYLLIAHGVQVVWFDRPGYSGGFSTLSAIHGGIMLKIFATVALALGLWLVYWRAKPFRVTNLPSDQKSSAALLPFFRRRVFAMMALADLVACSGLVLFLLTANMDFLLLGGIASYLMLTLAYPARSWFLQSAKRL